MKKEHFTHATILVEEEIEQLKAYGYLANALVNDLAINGCGDQDTVITAGTVIQEGIEELCECIQIKLTHNDDVRNEMFERLIDFKSEEENYNEQN